MNPKLRLVAVSAFALLISIPAFAQTPEASILPVNEPLDVGGTILQPGTYVIKVLRSQTDRNKVQITSEKGDKIFATVLTVPHTLEPGEEIPNTTFVFYPAGEGSPRALRTWFAPDPEASGGGHDIVYDESRARQLARIANATVTAYPSTAASADLETRELRVITPEPVVVRTPVVTTPVVETPAPMISSEPVPVQTADTTPMEMPQTASNLPLIALLGLASLGAAVTIHVARR